MFKKIFTYLFLYLFVFTHFFSFFVYAENASSNLENEENKILVQSSSQGEGVLNGSINNDSETSSSSVEQTEGQIGENSEEENKEQENKKQEEIGSGNTNNDSGSSQEGQETGSGNVEEESEEETGSGESIEEENEDIFETKVIFQNPSYILEKEEEDLEVYNCDSKKSECKVNFEFAGFLNSEKLTNSKIKCETNFGFETGKENDCNPSTIIFGKGENKVDYKIILKSDENLFKEGSFIVKNGETETNSETNTGSGNTNNDSLSSQEGQETGTGNIENELIEDETNTGSIEDLELPEINFEMQSGANFSSGNIWICKQRDDKTCKININLENSLSGFIQKDFACKIDFGSGASFSDGTDKKCNPGYVNYGTGIFEIKAKIYEKENEENFREKNFVLKNLDLENTEPAEEETGTGSIENNLAEDEENTGSGEINNDFETNGELQNGENETKTFDIKYSFQRPTYFLEEKPNFGTGKIVYNCDSSREECKVNLDFRPTFSGSLKESDFNCEINFGSGIITGEENKCNPNSVIFGIGETEVEYKIINKDDGNYFSTGSFFIKNSGYVKIENNILNESNPNLEDKQNIEENPKIKIQSGLNEDFFCNKKECSINLIYENDNKNLACIWDFGAGNIGKTNIKSCNPGYVKFTSGKHKITLKIYDKNYTNNYEENILEFENIYKVEELKARITLQGRLAKYKKLLGNTLICNGVDECSVNLTGEESSGEIEKYLWDFGNGEKFEGKNPKSVKFGVGNYEIKLKIFGENGQISEESFFVEVLAEKQEIEIKKFDLDFLIFLNNYYENLSFVKREKFLENKREELRKIFKLYNRKNKTFSTAYGEFLGEKSILLEKKGANFLGLFYDKKVLVKTSEIGKFKERFSYDVSGNFVLKAYILDEKLGIFEVGKEKKFEINLADLEKGEKFIEEEKNQDKISKKSNKGDLESKKIIQPKITIQGKIGKNKILEESKIICLGGKTCSVNFDGSESSGDFVEIIWDFGNGEKFIGKNPKSVKYEETGKYLVSLNLRDKFGEVYEKIFEVEFRKNIAKSSSKSTKIKTGEVKLKIEIQGKIGKNKVLEENKLTCIGTCSVNFDGRNSSGTYKKLFWDFGNGETFEGENPGYVKYEKFGEYKVKLFTEDYNGTKFEKEFLVNFVEKVKPHPNPPLIGEGIGSGKTEKIEKTQILEENKNKDGKIFIFIIIMMILSGSLILLKRYKIL